VAIHYIKKEELLPLLETKLNEESQRGPCETLAEFAIGGFSI
jgi:predicted house-cleaning noncanonical NTP pyrophosphatase (MazG superfamily)